MMIKRYSIYSINILFFCRNSERQMPIVNVQRRVDGNLVYGSVNEVTNEQNGETKPPQFGVPGAVAAPSDALLESIGSLEVC